MKYFFTFIFLFSFGTGCEPKILSGVELENKLKETMKNYLHKTLEPGTNVTIKEVIYYPEKTKKIYLCQFQVNIRSARSDTTGMVAATISNDFNTVIRTQ